MTYLIKITSVSDANEGTLASEPGPTTHYLRRVEIPDVQFAIKSIDSALNVKPRKPRSDAGKSRTQEVKP